MGSSVLPPFAEHADQVRLLKLKDRHFSRLYEELLQINQQITSIETHYASEAPQIDDLKIRRLYLTEQLHDIILASL